MIQALRHTPYTSAKFKTFSIKGEYRLNEFLADTGLPLQQCEQNYQSMDLALRHDLVPSFLAKADKYGLDELTYPSFNCNFGFRHKFCALDMVHCIQVTLLACINTGLYWYRLACDDTGFYQY